jgi:hypothetical protein
MVSTALPARRAHDGLARIFSWHRLRFTLAVSGGLGFVSGLGNDTAVPFDVTRACFMGCVVLFMFGLFETRPQVLPAWLPRTVLRLTGVVAGIPLSAICMVTLSQGLGSGLGRLVGAGLLFAPWIAIGTILRQRDTLVREQSFAFELERSEYERRELDARLRLLQGQVEPHFLFNTLANVQALMDSGSPQASRVLSSLIAYLRAAVPRMHSQNNTLSVEVDLVRAYLELMQMRIPDRLQFTINLEQKAALLHCPPMTLLTLVENAIRHGIDPSEAGGRIDVEVRVRGERCVMRVCDTGMGLNKLRGGLGTGLSTLRERLQLVYGGGAVLDLTGIKPHGTCAEISFPLRAVSK